MEVWAELTEPNPSHRSEPTTTQVVLETLQELLVLTSRICLLGGVAGQAGANVSGAETFWVPLQFWFCRNPGLALPLIALQYHEVKINLTFGAVAGFAETAATVTASLWADYIYLDTEERRRFAQVSHEYLIEQLQFTNSASSTSHDLNFNHPVKELIWTGGVTAAGAAAAGPSTPIAPTGGNYKLKLNGHDRFAERDLKYFTRTQVFQHPLDVVD